MFKIELFDDGNGSDGAYVTITDTGMKLLQMMKRLETVMSSELEEMEEPPDGLGA